MNKKIYITIYVIKLDLKLVMSGIFTNRVLLKMANQPGRKYILYHIPKFQVDLRTKLLKENIGLFIYRTFVECVLCARAHIPHILDSDMQMIILWVGLIL